MQSVNKSKEIRKLIIKKAIDHVADLGWTEKALKEAARDLNMSGAVVGQLFPEGGVAMPHYLLGHWEEQLAQVSSKDLLPLPLKDRVEFCMRRRLEMQTEVMPYWREAMLLGARPPYLGTTWSLLWSTWDLIWRRCGEEVAEPRHSIRRLALGNLHLATEVYMLNDNSENYRDSWLFLQNRVNNMFTLGNFVYTGIDLSSFVLKANYRILESYYPQPTSHENPIEDNKP